MDLISLYCDCYLKDKEKELLELYTIYYEKNRFNIFTKLYYKLKIKICEKKFINDLYFLEKLIKQD